MFPTLAHGTDTCDRHAAAPPHRVGIQDLLGPTAWLKLPPAVRARFAAAATAVDYVGAFEVVRASRLGKVFAFAARLFGTPIAPRTGLNVAASVRVSPLSEGTQWDRCYCWSDGAKTAVRSVKLIDAGNLIEKLSPHLCMPLSVYEHQGALHFQSQGYYFEFFSRTARPWRLALPPWLSPGVTHVEHKDLGGGWFRFTLRVEHARWGQLFFQTGRFRAAGG